MPLDHLVFLLKPRRATVRARLLPSFGRVFDEVRDTDKIWGKIERMSLFCAAGILGAIAFLLYKFRPTRVVDNCSVPACAGMVRLS